MKKQLLAVFGGAFSPVTNAHLSLAEQIADDYADKIVFLPVGDKYYKSGLIPAHHRVEMLKEICKSNPRFEVSEVEVKSDKLLNTIDSLKILQEEYPEYNIMFVMGSDNLKQIHTWNNYDELMQKFYFMTIARNGDNPLKIIEENPLLFKYKDKIIVAQESVRNDGNSTYVRNLINSGKSIRYLVPDEVYFYIQKNNLFKKGV